MPTIYYFALSTKETMSPRNQHTEKIQGIKKVPKDSGLNVSLIRNKITAINRDKLNASNVNIGTENLYILLKFMLTIITIV